MKGLRPAEILAATAHRPWPLPARAWLMFQRWHDLLFAHWPLAPERLAPLLPAGLEPDVHDGHGWLGIAPFRMSDVHVRGTPALPGLSAFPELNVRTYVRCAGTPGVFFFSLDAASALAVRVARAWFGLPYWHARMSCEPRGQGDPGIAYRSQRTNGAAELAVEYEPAGPVAPAPAGSLAWWLTERYCLFVARRGELWRSDVHHLPWPLQPATARFAANTMARAAGIELESDAPLLHFARQLDVCIWTPRRVGPH